MNGAAVLTISTMTDVVFASKEEQLAALQQHLKHTQVRPQQRLYA